MKVIHIFSAIIIILLGLVFLNITVDNETLKTVKFKILGGVFVTLGFYYFKGVTKSKQK